MLDDGGADRGHDRGPESSAVPPLETLRARIDPSSRSELNRYVDAAAITTGLFGQSTTSNIFMLGCAVQLGAIPISTESIERAIEVWLCTRTSLRSDMDGGGLWHPVRSSPLRTWGKQEPESLPHLIDRLVDDLTDYQNRAYADRFQRVIDSLVRAEVSVDPGSTAFAEAAARNLHKLMAYKDEYKVARLALLDESTEL